MSFHFDGFTSPRYTQVPDELFDQLLPVLSGAELKVLLYIVRRTFGFKKDCDPISLNQFMTGIRTRAGEQLDGGCGIADRSTVTKALSHLEEMGIIAATRHQGEDGVHVTTIYALRFLESPARVVGKSDHPEEGVVGKSDHGGSGEIRLPGSRKIRLGVVGKSDLQKTVDQQTVEQETGLVSKDSPAQPDETTEESSDEDRLVTPDLDAAMTQMTAELGDQRHGKSNQTRARNLMAQYAVDEFTMVKLAQAALSETQRHSGQLMNPAAYFFGVIEDRLKTVPGAKKSLAGRYWRQVRH